MARRRILVPARGFSLVELLVALLFTGLLMAGMAQVFKTSLGTFTSSGEILSAARRNRASVDLLYDDLNAAGMYLTDLVDPPKGTASNPNFYILPNMPVPGASADGPATADQLFFVFDQPLPFEGRLVTNAAKTADVGALNNEMDSPTDFTPTIDCLDPSYAAMVKPGMLFHIRDYFGHPLRISSATAAGSQVSIVLGGDPDVGIRGSGAVNSRQVVKHIIGSGVIFYLPLQMVRYSIQMKNLDPQQPAGVPCLVRDQGAYTESGFVRNPALETVVTENVSGFKVYLSADAGQNWAGYGQGYTGLSAGWSNGILSEIDSQLLTSGRADFKSTKLESTNWFRQTPVLVRLDLTTRTAVKREEYSPSPGSVAFKDVTQSLVLVPRHFGLAIK